MTRYPAYPAYKDSGVAWLGKIPSHWEVKRLRYTCTLNPGKSELSTFSPDTQVSFLPMEKIGEDGSFVLDEVRSLEQVWQGYTYFRDYDVVIAKITPCFENGKGALFEGLVNSIGFGTTELHVLRADQTTDPKFVFYLTRSYPFRHQGVSMMYGAAGQQRVPGEFLQNFTTGFPPLPEQRAIAAFLDERTAALDAAIAEYRRLSDLLQEQRAALISRAVIKGLAGLGITSGATHFPKCVAPDAPGYPAYKDSGIAWLGEIPSHWEIIKTKYLFKLSIDKAPEDNDYELLSLYTEIGVEPRKNLEPKGNKASTTDGYWIVRHGDIIVNKLLAWMGAIARSEYEGVTSPAYDILRPRSSIDSRFYHYLFRCGLYLPEFRRRSRGIMDMRLRLYFDELGQIPLPLPPLPEQRAIAAYLNAQTARIDAARAEIETAIAHLEEYRAALVAAAVPGKIDVRYS